jgi:Flp pilus assembly protein TadG
MRQKGIRGAMHMRFSKGDFRQRRGTVLVLVALSLTFVMAMTAFVMELSRLMADASELQNVADASALAGAYGLVKVRNATYTTIADSTASQNAAEGSAVPVTYRFGKWDTATKTLDTSGAVTITNADAVQATATLNASHFLGGLLGTTNVYSINRSAIAWAGGSITGTGCLKPWAVPVSALKVQLGYPATDNTPLTEADIEALMQGGATDTITIKNGSGGGDPSGQVSDNGLPAPGAFGAVQLVNPGAKPYLNSLEDQSCSNGSYSVGDTVQSEQGNIVGPTRDGICFLCNCPNPNGNTDVVCSPPYMATVIVYTTVISGGTHNEYVIGYFGVFKITGYSKSGSNGMVLGQFSGMSAAGDGFTPTPSPVIKLVLVK